MNKFVGSPTVGYPKQLLPQLVEALLELGVQLDINASRLPVEDRDTKRAWIGLIRQLYLIDALSGPRNVVVTGEQGAGKTLLMRNLYPQARDWLEDNAGRGEKNAVQIVERARCKAPRGRVTFRVPGPDAVTSGEMTRKEDFEAADLDRWRRLVRGEDPDVLLCTLEVPLGFWGLDGVGFVLLPGLERATEGQWQALMKVVLASSPAAILVADERRMANAAQRELLRHLRAGAGDMRFVVAISRCEASGPEVIEERVRRAVEVFEVDDADVVPIGRDASAPTDWPARLSERIDLIRSSGADHRLLEIEVLRSLIDDDLLALLDTARHAQAQQALDGGALDAAERYVEMFDGECEAVWNALERELERAFDPHMAEARARLDEILKVTGGWGGVKQRFKDFATLQRNEHYRRLAAQVEEAWRGPWDPLRPGGPLHAQLTSVQAVAEQCWDFVSVQSAGSITPDGRFDAEMTRALRGRPLESARNSRDADAVLRERSMDQVVRALPAMALFVRAAAIEHARPDGTIAAISTDEQTSWVERLTSDKKQMLVALGLLLGGDLLADGDLDTPANLANLAQIVFTGSAGGAGSAGAAAATGGAAATGMALVGSVMLATIGVGVVAAVLVKALGDAQAERENLAHRHLQAYRDASEQAVRQNVDDLLKLTRKALEARLHTALGVNRALNTQFALLTATTNLENVRARILKAIGYAEAS